MINELIRSHFPDDVTKATEFSKELLLLCINELNDYADDKFVQYKMSNNVYDLGKSDGGDDSREILENILDKL